MIWTWIIKEKKEHYGFCLTYENKMRLGEGADCVTTTSRRCNKNLHTTKRINKSNRYRWSKVALKLSSQRSKEKMQKGLFKNKINHFIFIYFLNVTFYFLAVLCDVWGLKFPDQGSNTCSLKWKHGPFTTGPAGKAQKGFFKTSFKYLLKRRSNKNILNILPKEKPSERKTSSCKIDGDFGFPSGIAVCQDSLSEPTDALGYKDLVWMVGMVGTWLLLVAKIWPQFKMFQLISTLRTVAAEMLLNILAEFEEQTDTKQRQWQEESVHLLNLILILLELLSCDYCWRNWVSVLYFNLYVLDIVEFVPLVYTLCSLVFTCKLAFRKNK